MLQMKTGRKTADYSCNVQCQMHGRESDGYAWGRLACVFGIILILCMPVRVLAIEVSDIIRHIDELWRGETSKANMSMTVNTSRYQRSMTMDAWSMGQEYSLIIIKKPVKDKDIATLKVEQNIWNYLPKINRVTKVPSSMMSGSWMGSHFTNDDLVKESTFLKDYTSRITFDGERDGRLVFEISSVPVENAAVVWGKVVTLVDQHTLAPVTSLYYDEDGLLVRTISFDRFEKLGNKTVPMKMSLQPEDKPAESTVIVYHNIEFGVPLDQAFFSLKNLKRGH